MRCTRIRLEKTVLINLGDFQHVKETVSAEYELGAEDTIYEAFERGHQQLTEALLFTCDQALRVAPPRTADSIRRTLDSTPLHVTEVVIDTDPSDPNWIPF